ncbi:MAG: imidazole glycerol phosphate synthase cyclase subunit, partial [Thermoanaerobaculia bacterium]
MSGATQPNVRASGAGGATALACRIIPCLDVADGQVVKGVRFEELAGFGSPAEAAKRYCADGALGADEIVFLDIAASHERRGPALEWIERVAESVFVPLTVGGGVRSLNDARALLAAGADKVALNSAAFERPELLTELAERYGRQCVVLSVDARRRRAGEGGGWEVVVQGGRRATGRDVLSWIEEGIDCGAGELLLTSIDRDGTGEGFDCELL